MTPESSSSRRGISSAEWAILWGSAMLFQYISQLEWFLSLRYPPLQLRDIFDSLVVIGAGAMLLAPGRAGLLLLLGAVLWVLAYAGGHRPTADGEPTALTE